MQADINKDSRLGEVPKAFDSLRSLVICGIGSKSSDISSVKEENNESLASQLIAQGIVKREVIEEEEDVPCIYMSAYESANLGDIEPNTSKNTLDDTNDTEGELLCKVVNPEQVGGESCLDPQAESEDVQDQTEGGSPNNLQISETHSLADDSATHGIISEMGITADDNVITLDISKALLHEVDSSEVTNMILESAARENSISFDSLRQLADNFLDTSQQASPPKRAAKRRGRRSKKCDQCGHKAKTVGDLDKHKKYVHGPKVYPCPVSGCSFTTKYPNNIRHHTNSAHSQVRPFKCDECSKSFKRKNQLETHKATHSDERPFACNQCDFRTKRNWILSMHVSTVHSDDRPFECEICHFKMKTRSDMNKHKRVHISEKKLPCPDCPKNFAHKTALKKHIQFMHKDIDLIPCEFKKCESKFKNKYAMKKHFKVVHEGVREFTCDICKRTYANKTNLELHIVVHDTENRPFLCPLCPFRFKEEFHLRAHLGSMHKMKHIGVFKCDVCHVRFKTNGGLSQHFKTTKHRRNARFAKTLEDSEVKPDPSEIRSPPREEEAGDPEQTEIKIEVVMD